MESTKNKFPKDIDRIRTIFKIIIFLLPILIGLNLLVEKIAPEEIASMFFMYLVILSLYYGIKNIKSWTVNLALILSTLSIITSVQKLFGLSNLPIESIFEYVLEIFIFFFYAYIMIVFLRPSTRLFFNEKGVTLI